MALKEYEVKVGNRRGETTAVMLLSEADAKRLGGKPLGEKPTERSKRATGRKAATPANKAATPENK